MEGEYVFSNALPWRLIKRLPDCCHGLEFFLYESSPGPEVIKLFSCSTQLSMKFILLLNVKMPTTVGILTFISMINTTSESRLKAINFSLVDILVFMSSWNFVLS